MPEDKMPVGLPAAKDPASPTPVVVIDPRKGVHYENREEVDNRVAVTFVDHYQVYNPGETAGFSPDEADHLIMIGIAVPEGQIPAKLFTNTTVTEPEYNKDAQVFAAKIPEVPIPVNAVTGLATGGVAGDALTHALTKALENGRTVGDFPRADARLQNLRQIQEGAAQVDTPEYMNPDRANATPVRAQTPEEEEEERKKGIQPGAGTSKGVSDAPPANKMVTPGETVRK